MARTVAKILVWSLLKIWTMWRLDEEFTSLNTYVPAGNTLIPVMYTGGISTGPLKVTVVFLSWSSALAVGENAAPRKDNPNTVGTAFKSVIFFYTPRGGGSTPGSIGIWPSIHAM